MLSYHRGPTWAGTEPGLAGLTMNEEDSEIRNSKWLLPLVGIITPLLNQGRFIEVPFRYMPRASGDSHARLIRFGWTYLRPLLRMWRLRNSAPALDSAR